MDFEESPHFEKRNGNMHPQRIVVICPGTSPKTNMRTKKQPFEDVYPISY